MFKRALIAACAFVFVTACGTTDHALEVNTKEFHAALAQFDTQTSQTHSVLDAEKAQFTELQWHAIEDVRRDTAALRDTIDAILLGELGGYSLDMPGFIAQAEQLRRSYRTAYQRIRPIVLNLKPSTAKQLKTFHTSIRALDSAYLDLKRAQTSEIDFVINTLELVATGFVLFGTD